MYVCMYVCMYVWMQASMCFCKLTHVYSPLLLLSYAPFVLSLSKQRRIRVLLGDIAHRRRAGRPVVKTHRAGSWGSNDPDVELNRVFFPVCVFLFC
jgi:hypothetical protein